jgi:hypothetical protein
MKLRKTSYFVQFSTIGLMAVYLFIVVTHLFFSPNFHAGPHFGNNSILKRNTELIYNLIRTDRSTFDENKTVKTFTKSYPGSSAWLINTKPFSVAIHGNSHLSQFLSDHHHSYLANRVIRI